MGRKVYSPTEWLIFMVNVGKYTSPMDPMGLVGDFLIFFTDSIRVSYN